MGVFRSPCTSDNLSIAFSAEQAGERKRAVALRASARTWPTVTYTRISLAGANHVTDVNGEKQLLCLQKRHLAKVGLSNSVTGNRKLGIVIWSTPRELRHHQSR